MATRFQSACDDNGQWLVRSAGKLYQISSRSSHQLPISGTLALRYSSETSDAEERKTNSCSPDSVETVGSDRTSSYFSPDVVNHQLSPAANKRGAESPTDHCNLLTINSSQSWGLPPSDTKETKFTTRLLLQSDSTGPAQRCTAKNFRKAYINTISNQLCSRRVADCENLHFSDHSTKNSNIHTLFKKADETLKSNDVLDLSCGNKSKNGSAPALQQAKDFRSHLPPRKTPANRTLDLEYERPLIPTFTIVKSDAVASDERGAERYMLDRFGENEAAQALLGLREVYFQPNSKENSEKSNSLSNHIMVETFTQKTVVATKQSSSSTPKIDETTAHACAQSDKVSSYQRSNPSGCGNLKKTKNSSKVHFKKRIYHQFVQSQDRGKDNIQLQTTPSVTTVDSHAPLSSNPQNGDSRLCDIKDVSGTQGNCKIPITHGVYRQSVGDWKNECIMSEQLTDRSMVSYQVSPCSEISNGNLIENSPNSKFLKVNQQVTRNTVKSHEDILQQKQLLLQQNDAAGNLSSFHNTAKISNNGKSNLYRLSCSLGSSSESLSSTDNEANDVVGTDSCSSSSDSDSDENDLSIPNWFLSKQDASSEHTKKISTQRKTFVLNKPKLFLPLNSTSEKLFINSLSPSTVFQNSSVEKGKVDPKNVCQDNPDTAFRFLVSKTKINHSMSKTFQPVKQNPVHIKKATFTFSGSFKNNKSAKRNGLTMTSKVANAVDRTQRAVEGRNSFCFDKDKLGCNETEKVKQAIQTLTNRVYTFGTFHQGESFVKLPKPNVKFCEVFARNKQSCKTQKANTLPKNYDVHRLPRTSARSAALEAHKLIKSKFARKRKLASPQGNLKESKKSLPGGDTAVKQSTKHEPHSNDQLKISSKIHKQVSKFSFNAQKRSDKKNGDTGSPADTSAGSLGLQMSVSRRKPVRVFKHQKYTSVSMMSSSHVPRGLSRSTDFAIIRKPLNFDQRLFLANALDNDAGSSDNSNIDASSSPSASGKIATKRPGQRCAVETEPRQCTLPKKLRLKRVLPVTELKKRRSVGLMGTSMFNSSRWNRRTSDSPFDSSFQLLSLFPAPASLRAGHAVGELLPGYGPSISGHRSTLPLRWKKGGDFTELKQKRQRSKWRGMTLDMFCMGQKS